MRYLDDGIWWCLCWNWLLAVWHLAFGSNISYICKFFNPTFNTILCYSSLITGVLVFKVGKPQIYMFSNVCSFLCLSISVKKSLVFNIPVYMNMHLIILSPVFSRSSQFEILILRTLNTASKDVNRNTIEMFESHWYQSIGYVDDHVLSACIFLPNKEWLRTTFVKIRKAEITELLESAKGKG